MKHYFAARSLFAALALATAFGVPSAPAGAAQTDLSPVPLGTAVTTAVLPNLMFILDDSGSMGFDYMPDQVNDATTCKVCTSSSCDVAGTSCAAGHPPFYAAPFNTIYYNPQITYTPGVNSDGSSKGNATTPFASNDPYSTAPPPAPGSRNIVTNWTEILWCSKNNPSAAELVDPNVCKKNGIDTTIPFAYNTTSNAAPFSGGFPTTGFRNSVTINTNAYYFEITAREYCTDATLAWCTLSTTQVTLSGTDYFVAAPVRWCNTAANAASTTAVSDTPPTTPKCQSKVDATYKFPRLGNIKRTDIVSTRPTYPKVAARTDCTGAVGATGCSYEQELQNFANWYSYYRTRMLFMKTGAGRVFSGMDDRYRIGFVTINASNSAKYLKIDKFDVTHKANWYTKFYAQSPGGFTPLRQALARVGRHYAGMTDGINSFMPAADDPIQYSCQQNFALLTTDGYWNTDNETVGPVRIDGKTLVGNQDNVVETFVNRPTGTLDAAGTKVTTVTRFTEVAQQVCTGTANTAFLTANGGTNVACGCSNSGPTKRIRQRTLVWDETVVTTDGVLGTPTTVNVSNTHTTVAGTPPSGTALGACVSNATSLIAAATSTTTGSPTTNTALGGFTNTLADVAMYYYKTDLRTSGPTSKSKNNVPTTSKDPATHQHMVTFTLGLGLDGLMNYRTDYETANSGDFKKIKDGVTGCSFSPGGTAAVCNWPQPAENAPTALDDLWHAAVNGRGNYFSAKDPNSLQSGLTAALTAIKVTTGAAAAAATSTPNVTPTDNFIYSSTYRTVKWDGEVFAEKIDVVTGALIPGISWSVSAKLDPRALPASDNRSIYTFDASNPSTKRKSFTYGNLTGTEAAFFDNHCTLPPAVWPQCGVMSPADLAIANSGANLVNYLRGQKQHETNYYRFREHALGDTVNAKPAFLGKPNLIYGDAVVPDYNSFKSGPAASRTPVLFIAANDGMLHAIHGGEDAVGGGTELWAYVPRMLMPQLFKLAANNYDVNHQFFVDGSPATMDVFLGGAWKTILVGGLNAGGRGFYALDVTDTSSPKGMWEICSDASLCDVSDPDLGKTFGQPIITKRPSDGKWVVIVTSGHNNVSPGDGGGHLFVLDAATGAVLSKTPTAISGTNVGDTTTPSGFAMIAGFALNFAVNNTTTIVYGGDLLGNVWRFDLSTDAAIPDGVTVQRIGQALDGSTPPKPQSITTKPEITRFDTSAPPFNVVYVATGRLLGASDLQDPATLTPPLNLAYQQSVYGLKDTGADVGNMRAPAAKLVQQVMTVIDVNNRTISNNAVDWTTQNGWWVDLNPANDSPGERVNIDMQLVRGVLLVNSNEPNNDACSIGGNSFFYQFDYRSGSYLASSPGQVVGVKLGAALSAGFVVYRLPSGQLKYTGIDITGTKQTGGVLPGSSGSLGRRATWRELYQ